MPTGFGIDPTRDVNGVITSGTTSQDIRNITAGMYSQGILTGCKVTTSTTTLKYHIYPGVVANDIGGGEVTLMPIADNYVTTTTGPATGTRVDYVYAKQNLVSVEGNSNIVYGVTSTKPAITAREIVIASFSVPTNMSNTSQATLYINQDYATPYGASGRYLVRASDTSNALISTNPVDLSGSFSIPTHRLIEVQILLSLGYEGTGPWDSIYADVHIDGSRKVRFNSGIIADSYSQVMSWTWSTLLPAGTHTISLKRFESHNTGKIKLLYGSNSYPGTVLTVKDGGVWDVEAY